MQGQRREGRKDTLFLCFLNHKRTWGMPAHHLRGVNLTGTAQCFLCITHPANRRAGSSLKPQVLYFRFSFQKTNIAMLTIKKQNKTKQEKTSYILHRSLKLTLELPDVRRMFFFYILLFSKFLHKFRYIHIYISIWLLPTFHQKEALGLALDSWFFYLFD